MLSNEERIRRLNRALMHAGPTHTISDLLELQKQGLCQFWRSDDDDGFVVTELHTFPLMKTIHYWLISGTLEACLPLEERINRWAVKQGCTVGTAVGRRGWKPIVEANGWREHGTTFWKPLTGEAQ